MKVEIWSDVMCPFCYIGKRHFEQSLKLANFKEEVLVEWKSFQLNPNLVTQPEKNSIEHLAQSKGWSYKQAQQAVQHVTQMAKKAGLNYQLEKAVVANSFDAHRLSHLAKKYQVQDNLEEALFQAYFIEGLNTADHKVLQIIGVSAGIPALEIEKLWNSTLFQKEVWDDIAEANNLGIQGVPFFIFNRRYAISGAQPIEVFVDALNAISTEKI